MPTLSFFRTNIDRRRRGCPAVLELYQIPIPVDGRFLFREQNQSPAETRNIKEKYARHNPFTTDSLDNLPPHLRGQTDRVPGLNYHAGK